MQRKGFWTAPDGTRIWFGIDGDGPSVILCDGVGCDGYVWPYVMDHLDDRFTFVRWHYRGHGYSEEPDDMNAGISIARLVEDLHGIIEHLTETDALHRPPILIGHSMGCQVILQYALDYPDDIEAAVLLCGSPGRVLDTFRNTTMFKDALGPLLSAIDRAPGLVERLWRGAMHSPLNWTVASRTEVNAKLVRRRDFMPYFQHMGRVKPETFLRMLKSAAEHSVRESLPDIKVPALIVAGKYDKFTPMHLSEEMAERLPLGELVVLEEGTHTAPLEQPKELNAALEAFLKRHALWDRS